MRCNKSRVEQPAACTALITPVSSAPWFKQNQNCPFLSPVHWFESAPASYKANNKAQLLVWFLTSTIPSMAVFTLRQYIRHQWRTLPQPGVVDGVSSKTFLVTGSNVGLGFETSVHLAKMRPKLLLATSRDLTKCEQTRKCKHFAAMPGFAGLT